MDRFDDIWKNRFNDSNVPVEDWNSPDDELVWEGIAKHLPTEEKNRKILWWWVIGALLTLAFLFSFILKNDSKASGSINQIQNNKTLLAHTVSNDKEVLASKEEEQSEMLVNPNSNQIRFNNPNSKKQNFNSKKISNSEIPKKLSKEKIEIKKKKLVKTRNQTLIDQIQSLKLENINIQESIDFNIPKAVLNKQKLKFLMSANVGIVYWKHRISDQYTSDLSPFEFNYTDNFGWQASLNLDYQIHRNLTVFGGIQYEQIESFSGHNSALTYSVANELNETNDYSQSLATPYGLAEASFRFSRNDDIGENDIDLLVDFESKHSIKNWSIPFGIKYAPFGQKNRLKPTLSLGFGVNYLSGISNKIHNIETHHDAINYENGGSSDFAKPDLNNWHYDIRLGLGLSYLISSNFQIRLNYGWSNGLNPVFQQENYETKINRHHWSLGVIKSLGTY
jgi:opacity protein-like surface antigen